MLKVSVGQYTGQNISLGKELNFSLFIADSKKLAYSEIENEYRKIAGHSMGDIVVDVDGLILEGII